MSANGEQATQKRQGEETGEDMRIGQGRHEQVGRGEQLGENKQVRNGEQRGEHKPLGNGEQPEEHKQVAHGEQTGEHEQVAHGEQTGEHEQVAHGEQTGEHEQAGPGEQIGEDTQVREGELLPQEAVGDLSAPQEVPGSVMEGQSFVALRLLSDVVALVVAGALAVAVGSTQAPLSSGSALLLLTFPALTVLLLYARGQYSQQLRPILTDDVAAVASAVSIAAMAIIAVTLMTDLNSRPGALVAPLWGLGLVLTASARVMLTALHTHRRMTRCGERPALIVGAGLIGAHIARHLQERPEYGLRPVGFLDSDPLPTLTANDRMPPLLGPPEQLSAVVAAHGVVHVIFGFIYDSDRRLLPLVRQCQALGLQVSVVPRLFDAHSQHSTLEPLGGLPLISLHSTNPRGWPFAVKHVLDRVAAALLIVVLAPLLAGLAIAVKLSSPGPVLFRQRRVGRDGEFFDLLKFRSMRVKAGDAEFKPRAGSAPGGVEGQDRRTGFGRWLRRTSLDELPQLFNVLKGEMSLIGPRPERPEFVDLFRADIERYGERHRVKSGITGWAQVHGLRGQTSIADRVEWDNYYIENWSLKLDLRIAALTLKVLLFGRAEE